MYRSSPSEVFLGKRVLKTCSKLTGEHSSRGANLNIEITLRHGCSSVHFLHIFRTPLPKNTRAPECRYARSVVRTYMQLMIVDMTKHGC